MSKHTQEPWVLFEVGDRHVHLCPASAANKTSILTVTEEGGVKFAAVYSDDDARRIVACVNACEGMDDPVEVIKGLKEALARTTHQVITCGVAARHPDANLSRRESDYGGKWDSPQAESVRQLRKERDELLEVQKDHHRLVRELDVLLNGVDGAAHQASLCDLVAQLKSKGGAA